MCEATLNYVYFYNYVLKIIDRIILARFDEVINKISAVIERVERRTPLSFGEYEAEKISQKAREYIKEWTKKHGQPSSMSLPVAGREKAKKKIRKQLKKSNKFKQAKKTFRCLNKVYNSDT